MSSATIGVECRDTDSVGSRTLIHDILPPEILSKIFHSLMSDAPWTRPRVKEAPLLLCSVCPRWRTTALASPELWDNLVVTFRDPSMVALTVARANAWLSRARSRKLSLWIFFFHSISANPIGEIVAGLHHQLSMLQVTSAPIGCLQSLLDFPAGSFPLLRTLKIEFPPPHFTWTRKSNTDVQLFPRLQDFSVSAGWTFVNLQFMPMNWGQLTALRVEKAAVTLPALCAVLVQCTSLIHCSLSVGESTLPRGPVNVRPTALPRLSTLSLQLNHGFDYFLAHFSLPFLSTVLLGRLIESAVAPGLHLLPSLASPTLRRLAVRMPCDPAHLLAILAGAPNLHELHMPFESQVISTLTLSSELLPRLAFITCFMTSGSVFAAAQGKELADMILARWSRPDIDRPRGFTIFPNSSDGWDTAMELLSDALAEGLQVQVRTDGDLSFSSD
ncbi:hypothetical protein DFH09DRAFT_1188044 [Mycena vulgaris]|nr:hypothetical protein DFH09DRAFT_1188044 [Mycena vulgaris]